MLGGSALLRALLLVAAIGAAVGLGRTYWTQETVPPRTPERSIAAAAAPIASVRRADPASRPADPSPVGASREPLLPSAAPAVAASRSLFDTQPSAPAAPQAEPPAPAARPAAAGRRVASADDGANLPTASLLDLNTASLAELNALRGGGSVGRAIVQHRPYASVDQLLSKRVLSRAVFQRVKDQVAVR